MLSSQRREFHKFFVQLIVAAMGFGFRGFFFREKVGKMRTKIFAFFRERFRLLETLVVTFDVSVYSG